MTKENSHLYLPMVKALADGKTIQFLRINMGWVDVDSSGTNFPEPPDRYRIKPEPVMVPLGPEDVPPGSVIRNGEGHWFMITDSFAEGVRITTYARRSRIEWDGLKTYWQIKRPGQDWQPCHKISA